MYITDIVLTKFLSIITYPLSVINVFVSGGLVHLYLHRSAWNWAPPFTATLPVVVFFLLSNIYLVVAPWIPPTQGSVYESLPYWIHVVVGFAILIAGGIYWLIWAVVLPKLGGYELQREVIVDGIDGWERNIFTKKPRGEAIQDRIQPGVFH